jgi:lipoate-protein ligase A
VLSYELHPALRLLDQAHRFVLERVQAAVERLRPGVELQGTSDLAWGGRKFSGNSLRCKREHLLYHGTLLADFPLERIEDVLGVAPRQPAYRAGRDHRDFIANLQLPLPALRHALAAAWQAGIPRSDWPRQATAELAARRYRDAQWNLHA